MRGLVRLPLCLPQVCRLKTLSFIRTGQEHVLAGDDLPSVVQGIRRVCAISSTLLGNVTQSNDEPPPPAPTSGSVSDKIQVISLPALLVTSGVSLLVVSIGFGIA
jgi:hypothetical protein